MIPSNEVQRLNSTPLQTALQRRLTMYTAKTCLSGNRSVCTKGNEEEEDDTEDEDDDTDS